LIEEDKQLNELRSSLGKAPSDLPISDLLPLFVPSSFFAQNNWPGPYEILGISGLGLTWAVLQPEQTMRYLDHRIQAYWESEGMAWRELAAENLRHQSKAEPWTHEFRRDGNALYAVAMMHPDGLGPSRLLLRDRMNQAFPEGYLVGIPEMSCGFAISKAASAVERDKIDYIVAQCFNCGTRPLVSGVYDSALLP
jgi:hypothetical protein